MPNLLYFVETVSPRVRGAWFTELDRDTNSRAHVIGLIRTGEITPIKVLEVNEDEGRVRDVTAEICGEAMEPALNSDDWYDRSKARMQLNKWDHARDMHKHEAV